MDQKEFNNRTIIELVLRKDYEDLRNIGTRILRKSRWFHWSKTLTNAILVLVFRHVVSIQRRKKNASPEDKTFYKQAEMLMRHIADSVAWRSLKYKRAQLRVMSENEPSGHIEDHEIPEVIRRVNQSSNVLIPNDITSYLRIGDLTEITDKGPVILELKKKADTYIKT